MSPVTISIRFAFSIRSWPDDRQIKIDHHSINGNTDDSGDDDEREPVYDKLPFGILQDPIRYNDLNFGMPCHLDIFFRAEV